MLEISKVHASCIHDVGIAAPSRSRKLLTIKCVGLRPVRELRQVPRRGGPVGRARPIRRGDHVDERRPHARRPNQQVAAFYDVDDTARAGERNAARARVDREHRAVNRCHQRFAGLHPKEVERAGYDAERRVTAVAGDELSGSRAHEGHARAGLKGRRALSAGTRDDHDQVRRDVDSRPVGDRLTARERVFHRGATADRHARG